MLTKRWRRKPHRPSGGVSKRKINIIDNFEGYNKRYHGKDIVKSVDFSKRNPIETEVVSGDNLAFAYLENFGLKKEGNAYRADANAPRSFTYTDDYPEVEVVSVEE